MTTLAKTIVTGFAGAVLVLAVLFAIAAADAWGGDMRDDDGDAYMGMMGAMGDIDPEDMMTHMRDMMMDDELWAQMQEHMADHESMPMASEMGTDGMMHQMMDHTMSGRGGGHHAN